MNNGKYQKTLIISDIHYKVDRANRIIKAEMPDVVVFSGDFFDPKGGMDSIDLAINTANWLKSIIEDPKSIELPRDIEYKFVEGNHDAPYKRGESEYIRCSGYDEDKAREINKILNKSHWDKLVRYHWVGDYLVSHAGVSAHHIPRKWLIYPPTKEEMTEWLQQEVIESEKACKDNKPHWIYGAGEARGGWQKVGGINWCDFDNEFYYIPGIKQLVGHTADRATRTTENGDMCIDTILNHYAVHIGDKLEVKGYADL